MFMKNVFKFWIANLFLVGICFGTMACIFTPDYEYIKSDNGYIIEFCWKSAREITFPEEYKREPIVEINSLVFGIRGNARILRIPDSVLIIDSSAFYKLENLEECYLGNSVQKIGEAAFYDCTSLRLIEIPTSVTEIEENAFFGCGKLTIYGYAGSYAEQYAEENGIPFVAKE